MKLFNEKDENDPLVKNFDSKMGEAARKRLVSDDIFKEIDGQGFFERPKEQEKKRVQIIEDEQEQSEQDDNDESPYKSSSPDRYDEEEDHDDASQESMEGLHIENFSDKHL